MLWGSIAWCSGLVEAVQSAARGVHGLKCFKVQFTAWCSDRMEGSNAESATEECMAAWKKHSLYLGVQTAVHIHGNVKEKNRKIPMSGNFEYWRVLLLW